MSDNNNTASLIIFQGLLQAAAAGRGGCGAAANQLII